MGFSIGEGSGSRNPSFQETQQLFELHVFNPIDKAIHPTPESSNVNAGSSPLRFR